MLVRVLATYRSVPVTKQQALKLILTLKDMGFDPWVEELEEDVVSERSNNTGASVEDGVHRP